MIGTVEIKHPSSARTWSDIMDDFDRIASERSSRSECTTRVWDSTTARVDRVFGELGYAEVWDKHLKKYCFITKGTYLDYPERYDLYK